MPEEYKGYLPATPISSIAPQPPLVYGFPSRNSTISRSLYMVENVPLHSRANGRQFDRHDQVAAALEAHQPGAWNGGSRIFGVLEKLQRVVCGMDDQRRGANPPNLVTGHRRAIVERRAGAAQGDWIHLVDDPVDQLPLRRCQLGDDGVVRAHQRHKLRA